MATKKHGRNKDKCKLYQSNGTRRKNKVRNLKKRLKGYKSPENYMIDEDKFMIVKVK